MQPHMWMPQDVQMTLSLYTWYSRSCLTFGTAVCSKAVMPLNANPEWDGKGSVGSGLVPRVTLGVPKVKVYKANGTRAG